MELASKEEGITYFVEGGVASQTFTANKSRLEVAIIEAIAAFGLELTTEAPADRAAAAAAAAARKTTREGGGAVGGNQKFTTFSKS